jgi:hypothetical protein
MPMIISAKLAGQIIYAKLTNSRDFEIVFPKLFGFVMKVLKHLPNSLYLKLTSRLLK